MQPDTCGEHWQANLYARNARFVSRLASDLIDVLDPKPGQRVLDIGCGDGVFSQLIQARGADVVGVDPAADMVRSARSRGVDARVCAIQDFDEQNAFDLAVSNAVFHWIPEPRRALAAVFRALRPNARFVGEMGGHGNIAAVIRVLTPLLADQGIEFVDRNPWNFPDCDSWSADLRSAGFTVTSADLFERPTPLPTSFGDWIDTFGGSLLAGLPPSVRAAIKSAAENAAEPELRRTDGTWVLDYVRLRFVAVKPEHGPGSTEPVLEP